MSRYDSTAFEHNLESTLMSEGQKILEYLRHKPSPFFRESFWHKKILKQILDHHDFKVALFQFIDILPSLTHPDDIHVLFDEYLSDYISPLKPDYFRLFDYLRRKTASPLIARVLKRNIYQIATMFIPGESIGTAADRIIPLIQKRFGVTLDLLGEKTLTLQEGHDYLQKYSALAQDFSCLVKTRNISSSLNIEGLGPVPHAHISIKLSSLSPHWNYHDPHHAVATMQALITPLIFYAVQNRIFIHFDMEQFSTLEITLQLLEKLLVTDEFKEYPFFGMVLQSYLVDSSAILQRMRRLSERRDCPFFIRLVKGAYLEYEQIQSELYNRRCPVFLNKSDTDSRFEYLSRTLIDMFPALIPAIASHNLRSILHATTYASLKGLSKETFELQMLYGMNDSCAVYFNQQGYNVRLYTPLGQFLPGMAYFVRRLLENTSNQSFLRMEYMEEEDESVLLQKPNPASEFISQSLTHDDGLPFENAPTLALYNTDISDKLNRTIHEFDYFTKYSPFPVVVNGEFFHAERYNRHSVLSPDTTLLSFSLASPIHCDQALISCERHAHTWKQSDLSLRVGLCHTLAAQLEHHRMKLIACLVHEIGKSREESDYEVREAIDFCRYYATEAKRLFGKKLLQRFLQGERNDTYYEGKGTCVVISPWNFPLAILCGMSVAALVSGNPVILKPSELSTGIAFYFFDLLRESGFPKEIIHFLPGLGEITGDYLVRHSSSKIIAFTGSKEVSLKILDGSRHHINSSQRHVKQVITEMGGKNAIIVDETADPDEAIPGIIQSAFSFAGQKCSACSRVILTPNVSELFLKRFIQAVSVLKGGSPVEPKTELGPVIDEISAKRLLENIQTFKDSADLIYAGNFIESLPCYIPPHVFLTPQSDHPLMQEELFGPILTFFKAKSLEHAIEVANDTSFGLTAGIYSRKPSHINYFKQKLASGNLYINKPCTGAVVGRQPFGGIKLSGTGLQAGGSEYLLQFVNARTISENTLRHGFSPEVL